MVYYFALKVDIFSFLIINESLSITEYVFGQPLTSGMNYELN